ncbi:NEDD4-binding protein 2 [Trichonephila inaurata madagascariensis]|uniref:NEDD4-binding protein 2 n=1 Tax=Trichonephila inaurata madagascariensis TaxID=2747483 RepID=A0A8X7C0C9_9ARAC|nr:NEDD4-binding protein 2 [Trichonephila inaurata madagascariensis]
MPKRFAQNRVVKSKFNDGAEVFRNSAAVFDDTDPYQSLQYLIDIFQSRIEKDVISMVFSECALNMDQAMDSLMLLSNEGDLKPTSEESVIKVEGENVNSTNDLQKSLTENKVSQELVEDKLNVENNINAYKSEADLSSEKTNTLSDSFSLCLLPNNLIKTVPHYQNLNNTYGNEFSVNYQRFNVPHFNSQYHFPHEVSSAIAPDWNNGKCINTDEINRVIEKIELNHQVLIILRGLPGSGKSTLAKKLKFNGVICSTDDFFYQKGKYIFDFTKLDEAHHWNQNRAREAILNGITPVIIDNTNVERWEMSPYVSMGKKYNYDTVILEPNTPWKFKARELVNRNKHHVPKEKILKMLDKYEHHVTLSSFNKISSSTCADSTTTCIADSTSAINEEYKKPCVSLEAIVHREELSTDCLSEKDFNNSHNEIAVPKLLLPKNLSTTSNETEVQCNNITGDTFENDNFIDKNSTINNLEQLKTLIQDDSEDSQSVGSKNDIEVSNQDVSSWEEITEHDDDFLWKTASSHDIVTTFQHDTLLQNGDKVSNATKIIDSGCKPVDMLQNNSDVSSKHEVETEESNYSNFYLASPVNTMTSKPEKNMLTCSENVLHGNKEHGFLKSCSSAAINFEVDTNAKDKCIIYAMPCVDDKVNVLSEKKMIVEIGSNLKDIENNHFIEADNLKHESNSMCRNFIKQKEVNKSAKSFHESFIFENTKDNDCKNNDANLLEPKFSVSSLDTKLNMIGKTFDNTQSEFNKNVSFEEKLFIENDMGFEFIPRSEFKIGSESGNISSWTKDVDYSNDSNSVMTSLNQKVPIRENKNSILQEPTKGNEEKCLLDSVNPKPQRKDRKINMIFSKNALENKSFDRNSTHKESSLKSEECKKWENDDNIEEKNVCSDVIDMKNVSSIPKPPRNLSRSVTLDKNNSAESEPKNSVLDEQSFKSVNKKHKQRNRFIKEADLYIGKDWSFPQFIQNDVLKNDISDYSTKNVSYSTCSTQTEPSDFILINKIEKNQSYSSEYCILTFSGNVWKGKEKINFNHSEQDVKHISKVMSFEKSTCTEDLVIDIDKSEKISRLQECFPKISEDDFVHLLEVCHGDESWLVNLLLDAGYKYNEFDSERRYAQCQNNFEEDELKTDLHVLKLGSKIDSIELKNSGNEALKNNGNEASSETKDISENIKTLENDSIFYENRAQNFMNSNSKTIQTLQFTLDPAFALQLEELFGPVVCEDSASACPVFEIDLEFAKLIHNKWKTYVQNGSKLNRDNVKNQSIDQGCDQRSDKKNKKYTNLSVCKRNVGEPMSLTEIMDMEYALQLYKDEKLKKDKDPVIKMKRSKFYDMFPVADPVALDEIFESNNHCLEKCFAALGEDLHGQNLKRAESAKMLDKSADEWSKTNNYKDFENNDWSSWVSTEENIKNEEETVIPKLSTISSEARKLREIAADSYIQRQNCVQKAQNYYCRGMKTAASYYAQEGSDHAYNFKRANKEAADLITKERNSSLKPFVLDLHGLYVQEAIPALEKFLRDKKLEIQRKSQSGVVKISVITGQGLHSVQGPKLRPSVVEYLKRNGYHFADINPGTLEVYLSIDGPHQANVQNEPFMMETEF